VLQPEAAAAAAQFLLLSPFDSIHQNNQPLLFLTLISLSKSSFSSFQQKKNTNKKSTSASFITNNCYLLKTTQRIESSKSIFNTIEFFLQINSPVDDSVCLQNHCSDQQKKKKQ
jgi:hypothetical protein